jgi:hypothetical protein
MAMTTMTMVHKYVHQRTGQEQQQWQRPHHVRQVLCQQKIACNGTDDDEADRVTGTPKTRGSFMPGVVMEHGGLLPI